MLFKLVFSVPLNVFIGSGAKKIGDVKISSNVAIVTNAVVVNDVFSVNGCTVGGVPARVISNNSLSLNLVRTTEIVERNNFIS